MTPTDTPRQQILFFDEKIDRASMDYQGRRKLITQAKGGKRVLYSCFSPITAARQFGAALKMCRPADVDEELRVIYFHGGG